MISKAGLLRRLEKLETSGLTLSATERDIDVARKRAERSEAARIVIPECVDPVRRERALRDPELFLKTYFADLYWRPFETCHYKMMDAIYNRAKYGGRQAIAAPRGIGKSELVKGMLMFLVLAGLVRFPLPVAATGNHAKNIYKDFRKKIATSDLLLEDFPEVCYPVRALDGAPQRAGKQHVDGQLTQIVWSASDSLSLARVPGSPYGGVKMAYYGLDSAFRGINIDGDRPDFVLVDDPETRESAKSLMQAEDRDTILDQDVAGLAGEGKDLAIVVLTTIQNRNCLSFWLTDRKKKPAWNGMRFGTIEKWPDNMELWNDYIAKRHADQEAGDEHGLSAVAFARDNFDAMHSGHEMLTVHFDPKYLEDGTQLTYSGLQVAFNKIADTSMDAFCTEYQNDPPKGEEIERTSLTAGRVQSRLSGYQQGEVPNDTAFRAVGIDIGKFASHWADTAWSEEGCIGSVADYGVMETSGLSGESKDEAVELALLAALETWAERIMEDINPQIVLVDSGKWSQAIYEFCRRRGRPFYPSKGWDLKRFRMPKRDNDNVPFLEAYARRQIESRVWLYNVQTEYWKTWAQERFLSRTHGDDGLRVPGSMALFDNEGDPKRHLSFAHHMVAEEEQWIPMEGKEPKRIWRVKNAHNNHWLDAMALACAGAGCLGVRLVRPQVVVPAAPKRIESKPFTDPYGRAFVASGRR